VAEIEKRIGDLRYLIEGLSKERKKESEPYMQEKIDSVINRFEEALKLNIEELNKIIGSDTEKPEDEPLIREVKKGLDEHFEEMSGKQ
jgi:hypothetical protein